MAIYVFFSSLPEIHIKTIKDTENNQMRQKARNGVRLKVAAVKHTIAQRKRTISSEETTTTATLKSLILIKW